MTTVTHSAGPSYLLNLGVMWSRIHVNPPRQQPVLRARTSGGLGVSSPAPVKGRVGLQGLQGYLPQEEAEDYATSYTQRVHDGSSATGRSTLTVSADWHLCCGRAATRCRSHFSLHTQFSLHTCCNDQAVCQPTANTQQQAWAAYLLHVQDVQARCRRRQPTHAVMDLPRGCVPWWPPVGHRVCLHHRQVKPAVVAA